MEWNIQPTADHFKYSTSTTKNSPVVSAIDNVDVEVHPSDFRVEFNSESVQDPDTTLIKSIDDD